MHLPAQEVPIVPLPQSIDKGTGTFEASVIQMYLPPGESLLQQQLNEAFSQRYAPPSLSSDKGRATVWLGLADEDAALRKAFRQLGQWPNPAVNEQGYVLSIQTDQVLLMARSSQGLFYGVQSLRQLLRAGKLPVMEVADWPTLPYRGTMDDISRGPIPTLDYMKSQVRRYAELKMNLMTFYIEHVVQTDQHPSLAPASGVSLEEFKELSDYARDYHVELVGSFQSLGHFRNILYHPPYKELGITERMLEPGKAEAIQFLKEIYADMAPAFSSNLFNINGDEAWDLSRGKLKPLADSLGVGAVYAQHVLPLLEAVTALGKRPMMWGDIVLAHQDLLDILPQETILLTWDYGASESFAHMIDPIQQAGFEFMVCPGVLNSNRLLPDFNQATTNIQNFVTEGHEKGAMGMLNTVWDDGGRHFFSRDWYGVAYGAEQSWHPNELDRQQYDARFGPACYGDQAGLFPELIHTLNQLAELAPTQEMNDQILVSQLIPPRGERSQLSLSDWEEVQRICEEAQRQLDALQVGAFEGDVPFWQYTIDLYRYLADARYLLLDAANAYRKASFAQLKDRTEARQQVQTALGLVMQSQGALRSLRNRVLRLWLEENRTYWLDHALQPFEDQLADYAQTEALLVDALDDLDKGHYLPPPTEVRLAMEEQAGQYFRYWLTLGSFPIEQQPGRKPDYLEEMGGEAQARPSPGQLIKGPEGGTLMWDKTYTEQLAVVDLFDMYERNTEAMAYAYCRINSPKDQQVLATFGSNDGIAIYCNGELVFEKYEKRSLIPDEDRCLLPLKAGNNHVLIKVDQWQGDWGFSFRLPEVKVRNHKQKYRIVE